MIRGGDEGLGTFIFYLLLLFGVMMLPKYLRYRGSNYKTASGNSFFKTVFDKGNYGEFLTFTYLKKLKGQHKLLTNLYLTKEDGSTTEIDLIMLSETGIYVFESKNYSGWIFGDEKNKNWTQTFKNRQKYKFLNPIWQNKGHIKALKHVLDMSNNNLYKSYIVFSEQCTLKKINITSPNTKVIKRNQLVNTIKQDIQSSPNLLTIEEVDRLYSKLLRYACADDSIKKAHVDAIQVRRS